MSVMSVIIASGDLVRCPVTDDDNGDDDSSPQYASEQGAKTETER